MTPEVEEPLGSESAKPVPDDVDRSQNAIASEADAAPERPASDAREPHVDPAPSVPASDAPEAAPAPVAEEPPTDVAVPEPTPPEPEPDPLAIAAAECLDIAGPASAGVPTGAADADGQKARLARAAAACSEAATADPADPAVLFHAASIAQAKGDARTTFALLTRASVAGFGPAEARLGDYFLFGVGPQGQNIQKAVEHFQRAAALGDAAGMTTLALLHQVATGVPRDPARMVELMTGAADQGYHFAQYRLAQTYLTGEGFPGRADAALGIPDTAKAVDYFTRAADQGNLAAALELSTLYADPASGLPDNPAEQIRLTRMVANTGHAPAVAQMGVFYETGRGVAYDPAVAAGLYVKALESGELAFADLRRGAPGPWDRDTAIAFQLVLQERGLYNGALDGIVGAGTAAAAAQLATP
nr:tetratricopeptide repeat protein [Maritimibacter sp. DP1N21-5]